MILLPAIDLMGGQVVRLRQGKAEEKTVYSNDPAAFARQWAQAGGDFLHIVDLDAAFSGLSQNLAAVRAIVAAAGVPCELGGGMRSEAALQAAFDAGVARVVIGTRAAESMAFVAQMCARFGGERIAVGIDAREGFVSVKGWQEASPLRASELALQAEATGVGALIYTDIATDGMLTGPNFAEMERLLTTVRCPLIASGGVSCAEDVTRLNALRAPDGRALYGTIIGKALYDDKIDLPELVNTLRNS